MLSCLADLLACLRFYSRLPLPVLAFETGPFAMLDFGRAIRMLPLAGAILGALAAFVLWLAMRLGLPPMLAAPLSVAALVLATGAFHEDGLADCADALGAADVERRLAIMKDSRIGTFGGAALILSLILRVVSLAVMAETSMGLAATVLVGSAALSRVAGLLPLMLLAPARAEGAGHAAVKPRGASAALAWGLAVLLSLIPGLAGFGFPRNFVAIAAATVGAYGVTRIAAHKIGGQTGDVAGAAQQIAEILFLLVFAAQS